MFIKGDKHFFKKCKNVVQTPSAAPVDEGRGAGLNLPYYYYLFIFATEINKINNKYTLVLIKKHIKHYLVALLATRVGMHVY